MLGQILYAKTVDVGKIGVGKDFTPPRPPNRACGSPAHGSPVGGFLIGIGALKCKLRAWWKAHVQQKKHLSLGVKSTFDS